MVGTGGISHWPATPDSGKINEAWDREFLRRWQANDKAALLSYTDEATYRDAGQGGFEIRTFISVAAAARGRGSLQHYRPIPIFAVGCTVATMRHRLTHVAHDLGIQRELARRGPIRRAVPQTRAIHDRRCEVEGKPVFPPGGVRVRAIACEEYCIADGTAGDAGFVHAVLKIGAGRERCREARRPAPGCSKS